MKPVLFCQLILADVFFMVVFRAFYFSVLTDVRGASFSLGLASPNTLVAPSWKRENSDMPCPDGHCGKNTERPWCLCDFFRSY